MASNVLFLASCEINNASFGEDCTNARCVDANSMCVNSGGKQICTCANRYIWTGSTCTIGPTALTTNQTLEYPTDLSNTPVTLGTLFLDLLPVLTSLVTWDTSVTIYPDEKILQLTKINPTSYEISLQSVIDGDRTFLVALKAVSGDFQVQQIVPVHVKSVPRSVEVFSIFLVQGTRKDTSIADISRLARGGSFQIQTSDDTAKALFAVTQEGLVVCGRDISLDEVANTNVIAKEYNFNVTVDKGGTITKIAKLNVLIFKDKFQSDVRENWAGVIMRYSSSNGNNFLLEPKNVPAVAKLSTVDKSISLDDGVDYESLVKKSIEFEVEVKTMDDSMSTNIAVIIRITDENDETPEMIINADGKLPKLDFYLFEILAGSPNGTIVGVVDSMDKDTVGATSYILGGGFKDYFKVDDSGTIRSTVALQKSVFGPQFNLTVSATDGVRPSESVNAVILLSSITEDTKNLNKTFRYSVPEGRVAGEIGNVSLRNYTSYNFTNFLAQKMFFIDPLTGIVRTIRPLDRESDSTPTDFSVQAILDSEDQCHLVILGQLVVTIEDVNDMSPRFSQNSYTANMIEGSPVGTSVTTLIDIEVFDDDAGRNAELSFELSGRDEQYFRVEMNNRNRFTITTSNIPVDLEALTGDTLTFSIIAKDNPDNVSTQLRTTATITIIVQDANDNAPTFSSSPMYNVSEDSSRLSPVTTLSARDTDKTYNIITYHLITGGSGFFKIEESTGLLSTAKVLDRETTEKYLLTVHAVDNGIPKLTGTATVTVIVTDINDNSPVFTGSHIVDVKENSCPDIVTTVTATDADVGSNGNVRYSMSDSYFNVSPNGQVRCAMPLDFEKNSSHLLTIVATDLGSPSRSSSTTLTVNVMDVNDNSPIFGSTIYSVTIKRAEWENDKPILVLDVTDEDSGNFGEITNLALDSEVDLFSISGSNTPVLRVISTARKPSGPDVYNFSVTATDGGGRKGQTNVTVIVTGDDVKGIRFQQNDFLLAMEEEKDYSSTVIGKVTASSNQGITVEYEIIDRTDFIIDKTTGAITCKKPQDREKDGNQHFIVRAKDSKGKVPGDLAVVNVTVTDINDNAPEFLQSEESLYFFITENPTLDTFVGQIKAVDKDDGKNAELEYSIESQTPKIGFKINKSSGQISVSAEIDREEATQYILTIKVMDRGVTSRKSATTAAKITVFDVNDVTPYFNPTAYTVPLRESKQVGDFVMTVSASDDDFADNGTVSYEVQASSDCPFSISKGGEITLSKNLDYERDQEHECVILAKDMWVTCQSACVGQLTGTTTITVSVVDVNDNPPIFQNLPYRANVSRNAAIGDVVTSQIQATDADSKQQGNGVVKFFIISNQDYFQIDRDSGEITVATSLYKIKDDSVRLVLEARDTPQSDSEKKTQTSITINITSEKPRPFFNKTYTVDLTEHAEPSNQPLMRIEAFVQRLGGIVVCNGVNDCQYSIETSADAFDINPDTGDIRQKRELDREEVDGTILVTVKVIDKKYNESKTTDVRVNVQDINDNLPYFENLNATFIVNHKAKVNTTFGRLASKDRDLVSDPLYTIREIDDTNELKIGLWPNGSLYVRQSLLSWNETIEFDVKVDDNDTVISSKDTFKEENRQQRVFVFVRDENYNEHAPQFTKQVYDGYVKSLSKMGTSVHVDLRAYDADNDTVKYSIVRGNIRDTFSIDPVTARLTLQYDLDDSVPDELVLDVAAVDVAVPPKTGFCVVKIEVRDPTEIECIRQSEFDSLRTQSSQRTLFLGLFIALAVLLTAVIIYAIFTTYKWRRAVARGSRYNQNLQDAAKAGKETTGYDGLHGRKQETGYDQLGLEDFSGGVRNPGYVSAGSVGSSSMCQLPVGSPPEEPQPDY